MAKRPLHDILCEILGAPFPDGEDHCYYEPPTNTQLSYPCIVYNCANEVDQFADNISYDSSKRYKITIIDKDPDSKIPNKLKSTFSYCTSDRNFDFEGLSHFVYNLFYRGPRIKEENQNEQN